MVIRIIQAVFQFIGMLVVADLAVFILIMIGEDLRNKKAQETFMIAMNDSDNPALPEKVERIIHAYGTREIGMDDDENEIDFYYSCVRLGISSLIDADSYAWINTLFGYNVGWNNAAQLIDILWDSEVEALELTAGDKTDLIDTCRIYGLDMDFSKFAALTPAVTNYEYGEAKE